MGTIERDADPQRSSTEERSPALVTSIIGALRMVASQHLPEQIQRLCSVLDDQLFNLSGQTRDAHLESEYFLAMRLIRKESSALKSRYELLVSKTYDEFWGRHLKARFRSDVPSSETRNLDADQMTLVADEELEEDLAINSMAEKGKMLFQRDLYALDKRFAHLAGLEEIDPDDNPFGPKSLSRAFAGALAPLPLDLSLKLLVYKLYEQVVVRALGAFYSELNASLAQQGILPSTFRYQKPKSAASEASEPVDAETVPAKVLRTEQPGLQPPSYPEVFEQMQGLLDGWRIRMGLPPATPLGYSQPVVAVSDVLGALSSLQQPSILYMARGAGSLKEHVHSKLESTGVEHSRKPLGRREEDVIDMVSIIFDFILDDPNLPEPVKGLITRLQIPVVKVAIIEKGFFGLKNHPARLLLNALAQAGLGLDMEEGGRESPVFRTIETIVNRVLDEFNQDVKLFSDLLDEFTAFTDKEAQRSRVLEERTLQATHSKERLRLCKRKVAYEIAHRLEGKEIPLPIRSFLFNTWKDVMVLAYLRRDRSPSDWEGSLEVMDRLIWSVTAPLDPNTIKDLVESIPTLLSSVRSGLEALSLEPTIVAEALRNLQFCHNARLSPGSSELEPETVAEEAESKVEIRDPELARAIVEIRDSLPDIDDLIVVDLAEPVAAASVPDEFLAKAHALESGRWVEFRENGKRIRAKLSWKSQTTTTHVFVNRKGAKVMELSLPELAERFANGNVRVLEGTAIPLMDRALETLMSTLKGSAGSAPTPSAAG